MIEELYQSILDGIEIRQNLIKLKEILKKDFEEAKKHKPHVSPSAMRIKNLVKGDFSGLLALLKHEDAKVRKNVVLIMGLLQEPRFTPAIWRAYKEEQQLFVRSSYLTAISAYNYRPLLDEIKELHMELENKEIPEDEEKHYKEELKQLSEMILKAEGGVLHEFIGAGKPCEAILLTNRNYKELTLKRVKPYADEVAELNAGVIFKAKSIENILPIRTYEEILFVINDLKVCPADPFVAAQKIVESDFLSFLKRMHKTSGNPFYFRIELKADLEMCEKTVFTRKMAAEIEKLSKRQLLNSTKQYEVELRLIQSKNRNNNEEEYKVLVKLYTMGDRRFSYRREAVPYDIKPVNAALAMELAADRLLEGGQVLDPFCGGGVMLVERKRRLPAGTCYGLDIHGDSIKKAELNMRMARVMANLINRNFNDFKHEYLFDEIVTNMPTSKSSSADIEQIYKEFFSKAKQHLKERGVMVLYSHDKALIKKYAKGIYLIEKEFEISAKEGAYVYIISLRRE